MAATYLVLAMMMVLGILAYTFHAQGTAARREVHRSFLGERATGLARSALDEALTDFQLHANVPERGKPPEKQLALILRALPVGKPYEYTFDPVQARETADLPATIDPVKLVIQRITNTPTSSTAEKDASEIPPAIAAKIKRGWEEYYATGYCGPDMDLLYQFLKPTAEPAPSNLLLDAKTKVTLDGDVPVVRQLQLRRGVSHAITSIDHAEAIVAAMGVFPPTSKIDSSSGAMSMTLDDVHLAPFDLMRTVRRSDEKKSK